jgi:hypothetical protein
MKIQGDPPGSIAKMSGLPGSSIFFVHLNQAFVKEISELTGQLSDRYSYLFGDLFSGQF